MSKIEWTDVSWNPVIGCTRVSAGCDNCYAARMALRLAAMGQKAYDGLANAKHFTGVVRCLDDRLEQPLRWRKPRMIFVCSMADLFHPSVPFEFIDKVFAVMALCPQHTFQVLTKRPKRMAEYLLHRDIHIIDAISDGIGGESDERLPPVLPLENAWLGTSVSNQPDADKNVPWVLKCPAAVRFLSVEPMLGPVDFGAVGNDEEAYGRWDVLTGEATDTSLTWDTIEPNGTGPVHWVILGGESGPGARPCDVAWICDGVRQCREAGVPAFVKQLGSRCVIGNAAMAAALRTREIFRNASGQWSDKPDPPSVMYRQLITKHPKGGDPFEWPEDLQVREFPKMETADV